MTGPSTGGANSTRQQILRAAAFHFARRSYGFVSLDDILAEAHVTKGAMYFHFRSKHALASAVIADQTNRGQAAVNEILARRLSGLETLVDISYLLAVQDTGQNVTRAGLNLLESIGRVDGLQARLLGEWAKTLSVIAQRAIDEGDIGEQHDPGDVGRILVSLYMGSRQTGNLDEPERFLVDLEKAWALLLAGFVNPDRIEYFTQFIGRRTARAVSMVGPR